MKALAKMLVLISQSKPCEKTQPFKKGVIQAYSFNQTLFHHRSLPKLESTPVSLTIPIK